MKDILYGLIGIIAALAIFAGGVIIGAGYLKAALDGAGEETTQDTSTGAVTVSSGTAAAGGTETYGAGGSTSVVQTVSYPQTSVISLESATPVMARTGTADPATPAGTTDDIPGTMAASLDRLFAELEDLLSDHDDDGIRFELSYNYTQKNLLVFMFPTGNDTDTYSKEALSGNQIAAADWDNITGRVNTVSAALRRGLDANGYEDVTAYVQLWDKPSDGKPLLTSENGETVYDYFKETGGITGRQDAAPAQSASSASGTSDTAPAVQVQSETQSAPAASGSASTQGAPATGGTGAAPSGQAAAQSASSATGATGTAAPANTADSNPYNYDFPAHVWLSATDNYFHEKNACGHMDPNYATPETNCQGTLGIRS